MILTLKIKNQVDQKPVAKNDIFLEIDQLAMPLLDRKWSLSNRIKNIRPLAIFYGLKLFKSLHRGCICTMFIHKITPLCMQMSLFKA